MTFFFRNSQGKQAACPICCDKVTVDPLVTLGHVKCSKCNHPLWFIQFHESAVFFDLAETAEKKDVAIEYLSTRLKVAPDQIADNPDLMYSAAVDSLGVLEVFAELETKLAT